MKKIINNKLFQFTLVGIAGYTLGLNTGRDPIWNGWKADWAGVLASTILLAVTIYYNHMLLKRQILKDNEEYLKKAKMEVSGLKYIKQLNELTIKLTTHQTEIMHLTLSIGDELINKKKILNIGKLESLTKSYYSCKNDLEEISLTIKNQNLFFPSGTDHKKIGDMEKKNIIQLNQNILDINTEIDRLRSISDSKHLSDYHQNNHLIDEILKSISDFKRYSRYIQSILDLLNV